MPHTSRPALTGLLLATTGAIAFSGKAIIVKLSYLYGVDAVTVIMYRMLFALPFFIVMGLWAERQAIARENPLTRRDVMDIVGLGFVGYYLSSYLDFLGLQYITASLERLILYLNPTLVVLLGWAVYKKPIQPVRMLAMAVSYSGVLLVFAHELSFAGAEVVLGGSLVLGSAVSYAIYLVYSGEMVKRLGSLRLVGLASTVACLLCIAQFVLLRPLDAALVAPPVIWLSVLNAVACTVTPVLLVMMAIERIGAGLTAQTGMIGPLSTIAMGVVLLDEPFNAWIIAGTALVMGGVVLVTRGR